MICTERDASFDHIIAGRAGEVARSDDLDITDGAVTLRSGSRYNRKTLYQTNRGLTEAAPEPLGGLLGPPPSVSKDLGVSRRALRDHDDETRTLVLRD